MDNPEKLATLDTQEEDKLNKKHNTICDGHHFMQTRTNNVNNAVCLAKKQLIPIL